MIRLRDALTMAMTKRRARKVRTALTVAVAGILFGAVMAVAMVTDGAFKSVDAMTKKSMTGRYIISGTVVPRDSMAMTEDPVLIAKADAEYKRIVAAKKAEAKRLGLEYDSAQEVLPVDKTGDRQSLSFQSPIAQTVLSEAIKAKYPAPTFDDFKRFAQSYHPSRYYNATFARPANGNISEMKLDRESFDASPDSTSQMSSPADLQETTIVPKALLAAYMLPAPAWRPESGHIPVVVSQKRAAELAKFPAPKKDAPAQERLNYANDLRTRVNGKTFTACYRNTVSTQQIGQAINTAKEIDAHKNDKQYQKPALIYGTPDPTTCGAATIVRDVRTAAEKQMADKQRQFDKTFGEEVEPLQQKLTYEVVGVSPNGWADSGMEMSMGMGDMITSILMSQTFRFAIPAELYDSMPSKATYRDALNTETQDNRMAFMTPPTSYYAEFSSAVDARNFAKNESCQYGGSGCMPKTKPFMMTPFGSNSIALDEVKSSVNRSLLWAIGVVTVIAVLIAGFTIARTIADGRRETAVFRAIGFRRIDITQIYTTYTLLLCLDIAIFALLLGGAVALYVNQRLWLDATVKTQLALGIYDASVRFSFIGLSRELLYIVAAIFTAGIIGMAIPLLRNVRRNPIRDMRDE